MPFPFRLSLSSLACLLLAAFLGARNASCQTFSTTGSLAEPRLRATATRLQNGNILVVGGGNTTGATTTAEIYSTSSQTFVPAGSTYVSFDCGSTATLLNDGTVLVTGGGAAELYFPSSGTFSLSTPPTLTSQQGVLIGAMTAVRCNSTATLLQNGTVLIAGGDIGDWAGLTSAEIYNPATGQFTTTTGSMSTRRTTHTATLLPNGTVLIAGGQGNYSGQTAWNTAEVYNPSTEMFALVGNMTTPRCYQTATLLTDGAVLIAGGRNNNSAALSSAEIYAPSSQSFAATGSMNSGRVNFTATPLADGTALEAGGFNVSGNPLNSAEIYSPLAGTFTLTGNMTTARAYQAATIIYNGDILMAGGTDNYPSSALSSAELYSYPVTESVIYPSYQVTSIIYAPPGNKSQDGFTDTTTDSTTTTVGSNFTQGSSVTFSEGFGNCQTGCATASEGFGTSSTGTSSSAFQETYSWATQVADQSNSNAPDAINHNEDLFLIWLDPQVSIFGNASAPVGYNLGVQPLANGTTPLPDIVRVFASEMEPNAAGVTTVDAPTLNQQNTPAGYVPGLAAICKNLNQSEYAAMACTQTDQCGCTPADFAPILAMDPLLFYNGPSNPISPYPGTVSPLEANTSSGSQSDANCGTLPTPNLTGSDCRFVKVPSGPGSPEQFDLSYLGPTSQGGSSSPTGGTVGESQQATQTLGTQTSETVSFSLKLGTTLFSMTSQDQWTWTQIQSLGTASGSGVALTVSLNSGTTNCQENVGFFEDTVYHTLAFQEFPDPGSECTQNAPSFSISATPNNPAQTALSLGHSMSYTVDISAWYGFSGSVALSLSGLPQGVTANFSPTSVTTSSISSSALTLTSSYNNPTTRIGSFPITVTGTSGSETQSAPFTLTTQPLQYRGYCGIR